jgi:colanic acid biosynthesis glycosyl transferase WcaI
MRILINDYAGHPFELQLSRELARRGHSVLHTYFAAYQTPKGRTDVDSETSGDLTIDPVSIGFEFGQHSAFSRRAADKAYGKKVSQRIRLFCPDIVISANTPLDAQKQLLEATHAIGARFVFWLQDILSVAIAFVLRKKHFPLASLAGYLYSRLERQLLKDSDAIVCIAPDFQLHLQRWDIPLTKIFVIENWAPLDEISPAHDNTPWALEHNLVGKTVFMYSGTLGMKHRPELLLELAKKYEHREDVAVVVVAQGAGADWLNENASSLRPGVISVLPFQPYERHAEVLASSSVLITLLDDDCGAFAVPSKTLAYMCAGRSLLVAAPATNLISKIIERATAGIATSATPKSFLDGAARLLKNPQYRATCGVNARAYAEQTFQIETICNQFMNAFTFALQGTDFIATESFPEKLPTTVAAE